jgi:uncharacterized membrane protein
MGGAALYYGGIAIVSSVLSSLGSEFMSPEHSRGAHVLVSNMSGVGVLFKYINLSLSVFLIVGLIYVLVDRKHKFKFNVIYLAMSIYFTIILINSVILPKFAAMDPGRLFILALTTCAPLCVIGMVYLSTIIASKIKYLNKKMDYKRHIPKLISVFLVLLLLINTGFISEVAKNYQRSVPLSLYTVDKYGTKDDIAEVYRRVIITYDVYSIMWLSKYNSNHKEIYATTGRSPIWSIPYNFGDWNYSIHQVMPENTIKKGSYLWVIYVNTRYDIGFGISGGVNLFDWFDFSNFYQKWKYKSTAKIYDNGNDHIVLI